MGRNQTEIGGSRFWFPHPHERQQAKQLGDVNHAVNIILDHHISFGAQVLAAQPVSVKLDPKTGLSEADVLHLMAPVHAAFRKVGNTYPIVSPIGLYGAYIENGETVRRLVGYTLLNLQNPMNFEGRILSFRTDSSGKRVLSRVSEIGTNNERIIPFRWSDALQYELEQYESIITGSLEGIPAGKDQFWEFYTNRHLAFIGSRKSRMREWLTHLEGNTEALVVPFAVNLGLDYSRLEATVKSGPIHPRVTVPDIRRAALYIPGFVDKSASTRLPHPVQTSRPSNQRLYDRLVGYSEPERDRYT